MSRGELQEHRIYLADDRKLAAYRAALAEVVKPGDVVLDLGSGTGLLGYLACEAGAKSVIAVDGGDIIAAAREIAAANGYADRIIHIQALSTETALPTPADVAVCDQIGGLVYDAGILAFYADARKRLLAPGARLIPAAFEIMLAPVTFEAGRKAVDFWSSRPGSIDVSPIHPLAANTEWHYNPAPEDIEKLAGGKVLASFASDHDDPIKGSATFEVEVPGSFDGFLGWFVSRLSPSVTLTNDPWSPDRLERWSNFYALDKATPLSPGDCVRLDLDVRPRLSLVSWSTTVLHSDGRTHRSRQSTFNSSFLSASAVNGFVTDQPVGTSERSELIRQVLDMIDGRRTQRDIVSLLSDRVGTDFASPTHLENFVRRVVKLNSRDLM